MKTVWKYRLVMAALSYDVLEMPKGAEILCLEMQYGHLTIWALVDPEADKEERKFRIAGTGHDIEEKNLRYVGTVQYFDGSFVVHVFEVLGGDTECEK